MKSYYELLGVGHRASTQAIEQRYRNYLTAHIARHGARPLSRAQRQRLQQMRTAYLLLSSPRRRALYDRELLLAAQQHARRVQTCGTLLGGLLLVVGLVLMGAHSFLPAQPQVERDASVQAEASSPMLVATETAAADNTQAH